MSRPITPATSLINLRKDAKRWLKALRAGTADARTRLEQAYPAAPARPGLRDVQHALAREYGYDNWIALKAAVARPTDDSGWPLVTAEAYAELADDFVQAYDAQDQAALDRLNTHYRRTFTFDDLAAEIWRRNYAFRQRSSRVPKNSLPRGEAQMLVAQDAGFGSWDALIRALETGGTRVPPYAIDAKDNAATPSRQMSDVEWDRLLADIKERRITSLDAGGLMTDDLLARVATLDHITALKLGGSRQLTDDGLQHLARMPQLERLDLSEYPGHRITDRGLDVLRYLPNLRHFEMTWQRGVSDAGVANLRFCRALEQVNLMGSSTGDGVIAALEGKSKLRRFSSGILVTDAGLRLVHALPLIKTLSGDGAHLLIDGPFTNAGLASLAGLEGVVELDLFWHVSGITSAGFAHLRELPNLAALGADGGLSDNDAMAHFAAMPRLRMLRAQEAVADDAGFEALSRSGTLERFWGRECPNFGSRGFMAFSKLPSLVALGVGCKNVDDRALATLPDFPSLRELTPIGVQDAGFVHVGRCHQLVRLTCMYCRETTDAATEQITRLPLTYYYAGLTKITDRSLELLARIASLEQVEFYECNGVTDAGLPFLATLPRLREVALEGLPGVTLDGTRVFPSHVRVRYST
jgi:hypothetical protein